MTALALALVLTAQAPTLDFKSESKPLDVVIPKLAEATKLKLSVDPDLKWRTVYLKVEQAPIEEVLDRLAKTFHARWDVKSDGSRVLRVDKMRVDKSTADTIALYRKNLRKFLTAKPGPEDLADKNRPILISALAGINPDDLVPSLRTRIVFSTAPTRMQRAFPRFDPAWANAMTKSHNEDIATQMAEFANQQSEMDEFLGKAPEEAREAIKSMIELSKPKTMTPGAAQKMLGVWTIQGSSGHFEVSLYDAKGDRLTEATLFVPLDDRGDYKEETEGEEQKKPEGDESPILSIDKKYADVVSERYWEMKPDTRKKIQEMVGDLRVSDPWLEASNDMVEKFVPHIKEKNVLIDMDAASYAFLRPKSTVKTLRDAFELDSPETKKVDNWVIIENEDSLPGLNRELANEVLANARAGKLKDLAGRGWLAYRHGQLGDAWRLLHLFQLEVEPSLALRIYGSMQPDQRVRATQNGVRVSELPERMRNEIAKEAYWEEDLFTPDGETGENMGFMAMFDMEKMLEYARKDMEKVELLNEPTETMPNGFPGEAVVRLKPANGDIYLITGPNGEDGGMGVDLDMLAMYTVMSEMEPNMKGQFDKVRIKKAKREAFEVSIDAGLVRHRGMIASDQTEEGSTPMTIGSVPGLSEVLAKRRESMKKWMPLIMGMGSMFGNRRETVPPPQD